MTVMFDSVTVSAIPADAPAVAGYVGGRWPTFSSLGARFPHAHLLSIAINASENARCLDVENGDAVPSQAPAWLRDHADRSHGLPVLYTSASQLQAVINACSAAGITRDKYLLWSAHYTFHAHICAPNVCGYPAADGCQWTDRALGRNLDESLVSALFFGPPPPPKDPEHYDWFEPIVRDLGGGRHGSERAVVQEYDLERRKWKLYPRRLHVLEDDMSILAGRLETVMAEAKGGGGVFERQWRHDQLVGRASGRRYV